MNAKNTVVQIVRWVSAALLCMVALWSLNLTAYNIWAAGFPPPSPSDVYEQRASLFLAVSLLALISAAYIIWHFRRRKA
jgi:membrane protein DedA with SNARE-associated domain